MKFFLKFFFYLLIIIFFAAGCATKEIVKVKEETKVEEAINHLKKSGDIFEPKRGFISRVG